MESGKGTQRPLALFLKPWWWIPLKWESGGQGLKERGWNMCVGRRKKLVYHVSTSFKTIM